MKMKKQINKILAIGFIVTGAILSQVLVSDTYAAESKTKTVTYPYYGFVEDPEHPWQTVFDALDETGTIEYSDEFFSEPSPGDHPGLRAMSYALALAGYENKADGYPSTSEISNPKLINLLDQMGFSDYKVWIVGYSRGVQWLI